MGRFVFDRPNEEHVRIEYLKSLLALYLLLPVTWHGCITLGEPMYRLITRLHSCGSTEDMLVIYYCVLY